MSDTDPPASAGTFSLDEKRDKAVQVIGEILKHMDLPAVLDAKISADGGISVSVELVGEPPGATPGRRTHVTDALQFLANKIVNRPGTERRWISLGIGGHPEPKQRQERKRPPASPPISAPSMPSPVSRKAGGGNGTTAAPIRREPEDVELQVPEDVQLTQAARELANRSNVLGRFYAITGMSREDRARVLQALRGTPGIRVAVEGEGRQRRVVFVPEKPAPLPKRTLPAVDDEE
jgi:predicted RNA-binding protein Jag